MPQRRLSAPAGGEKHRRAPEPRRGVPCYSKAPQLALLRGCALLHLTNKATAGPAQPQPDSPGCRHRPSRDTPRSGSGRAASIRLSSVALAGTQRSPSGDAYRGHGNGTRCRTRFRGSSCSRARGARPRAAAGCKGRSGASRKRKRGESCATRWGLRRSGAVGYILGPGAVCGLVRILVFGVAHVDVVE
jgi:hypothetical protein